MYYEFLQKEPPLGWPQTGYGVQAVRKNGEQIEIPVLPQTNVLILGTSGYGKTCFTKAYVRELFREDPERFAVFFQIKPDDFTEEFLHPQDKVVAYSSKLFPGQSFCWNLVKEIRSCPKEDWETELEAVASILFSDLLQDPKNRIWAEAAKQVFKAFILTLLHCYQNNPSNLQLIQGMREMDRKEFLKFLSQYGPNRGMLLDNFSFDPQNCEKYELPRKGSDIFFFLQNVLDKFGGTFLSADGQDTIYDYLHGQYGGRLFLLHDHKNRSSSRLFERYFLERIGDELLSQASDFHKGMLWILDEIDKVGYDFGLTQAVTLGRQFGLQVLLSTQSLESLYAVAPESYGEHLTNAALSGFGMTVAFHPGDPHTINTLQQLYGSTVKEKLPMPLSRYDKPVVTTELRPIVEDRDFASLQVGECYVKLGSERPERLQILL